MLSRDRAFILALHRVLRDDEISPCVHPEMYVTASVFRDLLFFLRRDYDVVPLAELVEQLTSKTRRQKPLCALTFDDGYMDNYTNAFPVLKEMRVPATIFLTASYVGSADLLWHDALYVAFARAAKSPLSRRHLRSLLFDRSPCAPADGQPVKGTEHLSARAVIEQAKTWPYARIQNLLSELKPLTLLNGPEAGRFRLLTWSQIREMLSDGMDFGSHALSHRILPLEDSQTIQREICDSKALIESKLGKPIVMLAYPNGAYDGETIRIARQAGFRIGLTLERQYISAASDPLCMGRFLVNQHDTVSCGGRFSPSLFEYEKSASVLYAKRLFEPTVRGKGAGKA